MATYIYRQRASNSAMDLAEALDAIRFRGRQIPIERKARRGDHIIAWGEAVPAIPGVQVLNGVPLTSKFTDALRLAEAGVSTVRVSRTKPAPEQAAPVVDPATGAYARAVELTDAFASNQVPTIRGNVVLAKGISDLFNSITALQNALARPLPVAAPVTQVIWLPRRNNHVGGNDLLREIPAAEAEFWAAKETFVKEYRIHSFLGKSIRAGVKALRDNFVDVQNQVRPGYQLASPWVRSWDGGWRILYDGVSSKKRHRELAHQAVAALGLDFGAVDIGERADKSLCVLEVNRAPGLEGGTIERYADAVRKWISGEWGRVGN